MEERRRLALNQERIGDQVGLTPMQQTGCQLAPHTDLSVVLRIKQGEQFSRPR